MNIHKEQPVIIEPVGLSKVVNNTIGSEAKTNRLVLKLRGK